MIVQVLPVKLKIFNYNTTVFNSPCTNKICNTNPIIPSIFAKRFFTLMTSSPKYFYFKKSESSETNYI